MVDSTLEEKNRDQNDAYFLGILLFVLILEGFAWWYCPITVVFGIIVLGIAYYHTKRLLWIDKPKIVYGIISIISWSFILGALEVFWFQNDSISFNLFYWFSDFIPYWLFIIFSGFFIILLVSRSLPFTFVATLCYLALEDCAYFIWHGTPPQNWFVYFSDYFPQWFIALGDPVPFWPYLPAFYLLIWAITIPLIGFLWYKSKR